MNVKVRSIEIAAETADALEARAAERGVSVSRLLSDLVTASAPLAVEDTQIAELDRRWASVAAGAATVPHDDVVRWLATWGTPAFRPWSER